MPAIYLAWAVALPAYQEMGEYGLYHVMVRACQCGLELPAVLHIAAVGSASCSKFLLLTRGRLRLTVEAKLREARMGKITRGEDITQPPNDVFIFL